MSVEPLREPGEFRDRVRATHRRRRATLSLLVAALTLLGTACEAPGRGTAHRSPSPAASPPFSTPPGGGVVRVIDQGYSAAKDGNGAEMVSYGIVLENTSRYVAFKTTVTIRMFDSAGKPITTPQRTSVTHTVYQVLPNERVGIGASTYSDRAGVTRFEVEVGRSQWWPVQNGFREFGALAATDVRTRIHGVGATVRFVVESELTDSVEHPVSYAIFRNAGGDIVGGAGPSRSAAIAPGTSEGALEARRGVPTGIKASLTQVYIQPDCC